MVLTLGGAKLLQSCPTLCDLIDHSWPGSSVCGILQARILEWVAISFSRGSSQPRNQTIEPRSPALKADSYRLSYEGSPVYVWWDIYMFVVYSVCIYVH